MLPIFKDTISSIFQCLTLTFFVLAKEENTTLPLSWTRSGQTLRSNSKNSKKGNHVLKSTLSQKMKHDSYFHRKKAKCNSFFNKKTVISYNLLKNTRFSSSDKFYKNDIMDKFSLVTRYQLMVKYKHKKLSFTGFLLPNRYVY